MNGALVSTHAAQVSSSRKACATSTSGSGCTFSTRSTFACDTAYPPLLGQPFSGCAGLVDVGVGRESHEQAVDREADGCRTASNLAAATNRTASLTEDRVADSVAEVDDLLGHHLELLVGGEPVLEEATDCGHTRVDAEATVRRVVNDVWSEAAQHRVEVAAIDSLNRSSKQLLPVGRRGLL